MNKIKYQKNGGRKMFLIFSKEKIQTYLVSILTVTILIVVANNRTKENCIYNELCME